MKMLYSGCLLSGDVTDSGWRRDSDRSAADEQSVPGDHCDAGAGCTTETTNTARTGPTVHRTYARRYLVNYQQGTVTS